MKTDFPVFALIIAVIADLVEVFATPIFGYIFAIPLDIFLYYWAKDYIGSGHTKNKIRESLVYRIALEYIPIVNMLPISTIFVFLAYRDKKILFLTKIK